MQQELLKAKPPIGSGHVTLMTSKKTTPILLLFSIKELQIMLNRIIVCKYFTDVYYTIAHVYIFEINI